MPIRLDSQTDNPNATWRGETPSLSEEGRRLLHAAIRTASPGRKLRLDEAVPPQVKALGFDWDPGDRELALESLRASGIEPSSFRPVAGSLPISMRSDEYVAAYAVENARQVLAAARADAGIPQQSFVWPDGWNRQRALSELAAHGVKLTGLSSVAIEKATDSDLAFELRALALRLSLTKFSGRIRADDAQRAAEPTDSDIARSRYALRYCADGSVEHEQRVMRHARKAAADRQHARRLELERLDEAPALSPAQVEIARKRAASRDEWKKPIKRTR